MKIAVTATGGAMSARVSEKFGRCAYFLIVDSETMKFEPVANSGMDMAGGAGPSAARQISDLGAKIILTGAVGPNAVRALEAAGIKAESGFTGDQTVREAVEKYLKKT